MSEKTRIRIPNITDVLLAARFLKGRVRHTPLEYSHYLSERIGAQVFLKLENMQHANSFKIRGALNKMYSLAPEVLSRGVVTASSGNHAQGLATAAAMLKTRAVVCVPESCPETKKDSVRARGGEYVELLVTGRQYDDTERAAFEIAESRRMTFVSAYEDTYIAAGQGTVALEMLTDEPELDVIFCPLSGGGLMTGVAAAARVLRPGIELWGAMAENNPSWVEAYKAGRVVTAAERDSLADALGGAASPLLFPYIRETINGLLPVSEASIAEWMATVHRVCHMVIEGGAATAVAAAMSGAVDVTGRKVGIVISGGNVDDAKLLKILAAN